MSNEVSPRITFQNDQSRLRLARAFSDSGIGNEKFSNLTNWLTRHTSVSAAAQGRLIRAVTEYRLKLAEVVDLLAEVESTLKPGPNAYGEHLESVSGSSGLPANSGDRASDSGLRNQTVSPNAASAVTSATNRPSDRLGLIAAVPSIRPGTSRQVNQKPLDQKVPAANAMATENRAYDREGARLKPKIMSLRIPNANCKQEYKLPLQQVLEEENPAIKFTSSFPSGLSLLEGSIVGTPSTPGEYVISWSIDNDLGRSGEFLLTINPDPRSLWKDIPSDHTDKYFKPDTDKALVITHSLGIVAASIRGRSHAHVGSFRDDDFRIDAPKENDSLGWYIVCVADGAGSAKYSRRGSQIACEETVNEIRNILRSKEDGVAQELNGRSMAACVEEKSDAAFWTRTLYHVFATAGSKVLSKIRDEAESSNAKVKDFSTTLLVAIIRRTQADAWFVGTYWVGDGAIGMWDKSWPSPKLFGEPDTGEFAGQTSFFTSEDFSKGETVTRRLRYTIVNDFGYLALMTDGISDAKFVTEQMLKENEPWALFSDDIREITSEIHSPESNADVKLLNWMDFWSPGNHDDRTLMLVVPKKHKIDS